MKLPISILTPIILTLFISTPTQAQAPAPAFLPPSPAPAPAPHYVNLTDLLSVAGPFSIFLNYVVQTKIIDTFQNQANNTDQGLTLFVPKNSAFTSLKQTTFSNLTDDQLKSLLLYHGFPKYYSLAEFKNLSALNPVSTFAGGEYTVNLTYDMGTVRVASKWSNPNITSSVYSTRPVAVYEVNKVLLPMQLFSADPPLAPAPAPAPESKPSDLAPKSSPSGSSPKSIDSANSAHVISTSYMLLWVLLGAIMFML
ncbi:Fasciclin-like arabinogalactan family protein [Rhynchospora pubera]|uniref:Fasciclin-like arabinogalactan family protein n=1 Tax=Rhynchospora pubera TaxID=906938 RepID=A0AAV8CW32_9POAL|nr:Fasciclin-like arabinogalactan family protein [Rhynchospora pubera]